MYSGDEYYDDDITSPSELEREAEAEFVYQRDVIGPLCGFDQEETTQ